MTVGSLCNLNFQQFTSAAFRGTVVRERERGSRGGEKKEKKRKKEECFGPGLTGIISDTVLSVDAVWARGPTERRAGDLWPPLIAIVGMHCGRVLRKIWTRSRGEK